MASAKVDEKTILEAATSVFAEKGWEGARIDAIASKAGLNKAMLYYRVGGKEELYRRVVLQGQEYFTRTVECALEMATGPEDAVRKIVETIAENAEKNRLFPSIILREMAGGGATLPRNGLDGIKNLMEVIRDLANRGMEKGVFREIDPVALQFMIMGAVFTLSLTADMRRSIAPDSPGPVTAEEIAASIGNILTGGILQGGEE